MSAPHPPEEETLRLMSKPGYKGAMSDAASWALQTIESLREQLPAGMKDCKIVFLECDKGHGRLSAANWIDHGCGFCREESLREQVARLEREKGDLDETLARVVTRKATMADDIERLADAADQARRERDEARGLLRKAWMRIRQDATTFRLYQAIHAAKGTVEGSSKARANGQFADDGEALLREIDAALPKEEPDGR